jgi:transposase
MERRIEKKVDWSKYTELGTLGMDEIALKKGHRDFVTVVSARLEDQRIVILGVLKNREKDTLIAFLRSIPQRLSETIHTICGDMYEGFSAAAREERVHAKVVRWLKGGLSDDRTKSAIVR